MAADSRPADFSLGLVAVAEDASAAATYVQVIQNIVVETLVISASRFSFTDDLGSGVCNLAGTTAVDCQYNGGSTGSSMVLAVHWTALALPI